MTLTEEKKKIFADWVNGNTNGDLKCPACSSDNFGVLDETVSSSYDNVGLMCSTCRHVMYFNITGLDLFGIVKENTGSPLCQECLYNEATMQNDEGEYLCSTCYNNV